jgi:hypothetical protein
MARRRRSERLGAGPPSIPVPRRVDLGADGYEYEVRPVPGARAVKTYRCPGCDHEIRSGIAHVVVLRIEDVEGEDRRHWHTACWANRANRGPTRRWS